MDVKEARETLGVMQTPNGSEKAQITKLTKKIDAWSRNVLPSGLKNADAREAVSTTIGKTIEYPLADTTMTKNECEISAVYQNLGLYEMHHWT